MKVLVTGGAGFIGHHICKVLLEEGHQVTVFDNLSTGHKETLPEGVNFIQGNLSSREQLNRAMIGQEAVIHMAAFIIVPESVEKPLLYIENNVMGTAYVLEAMRVSGVKKIVLSSSATVYGDPQNLPLKETDPLGIPENTYGATKVCMEFLAQSFQKSYGMDVCILRYFNPYGPGELHSPETHAVPNLVSAALRKEVIPLYWKGEQIRDFIYVEDLARAHTKVLDLTGLNIFNVGTETGTKVKDVIETIFSILGYTVGIKDLGERAGDVHANYASSALLKEQTGWIPSVDLKQGLTETIKFFQEKLSK